MSESVEPEGNLARRNLIRGGAIALGAAGAAVAVEALSAGKAHAADGDPISAGVPNAATSKTTLTMNSSSTPSLELTNGSGAALKLTPTAAAAPGTLSAGELISRPDGPEVVVDYGDGPELTYLATGFDLPPTTVAFEPFRVMDTRSAGFRAMVIRASTSSWFDSSKRVKAGAWIDVPLAAAEPGLDFSAVYLNVTAIGAPARGNLTVYPTGAATPAASNLNYPATTSIANLCFVPPAPYANYWCVRVKVNVAAAHVILDFSGAVGYFPPNPAAAPTSAHASRPKQSSQRGAEIRSRMVKGLKINE